MRGVAQETFLAYAAESNSLLTATATTIGQEQLDAAVDMITGALAAGAPLLVCGNGGSACDAMHITGELVARFLEERAAWKAICLASNPAVMTAWSNDQTYETVFSRQVEAYGEPGGVVLGISTSGNSGSVVAAFEQAKRMEMTTIALTGDGGGRLATLADLLLAVPSRSTPHIQQVHVCLYHYLCREIERRMIRLRRAADA